MCRSANVDQLLLTRISMSEDCMVFKSTEAKNDQTGKLDVINLNIISNILCVCDCGG
jgi:hypothetical protein